MTAPPAESYQIKPLLPNRSWAAGLAACAIIVLAALLRMYHLSVQPLWLDEGY